MDSVVDSVALTGSSYKESESSKLELSESEQLDDEEDAYPEVLSTSEQKVYVFRQSRAFSRPAFDLLKIKYCKCVYYQRLVLERIFTQDF